MEPIFERLRGKGVTLTPQRMAIVECLSGNRTHPTVDEIHSTIKVKYPTMSKATVYSTLKVLKDLGEVQELSIRKRGEVCFDPNVGMHHHFLCTSCGNIMDITLDCPDACPIICSSEIDGHRIDEIQAYLYGKCSNCTGKSSS
ncbi:MAG TPA: Fur family transcriptional regulator [Candidatus Krumholzibacterium sp.]|nr:Fur family transcriptional regulator [Candidatus Krumholzibacterium sp.]